MDPDIPSGAYALGILVAIYIFVICGGVKDTLKWIERRFYKHNEQG